MGSHLQRRGDDVGVFAPRSRRHIKCVIGVRDQIEGCAAAKPIDRLAEKITRLAML